MIHMLRKESGINKTMTNHKDKYFEVHITVENMEQYYLEDFCKHFKKKLLVVSPNCTKNNSDLDYMVTFDVNNDFDYTFGLMEHISNLIKFNESDATISRQKIECSEYLDGLPFQYVETHFVINEYESFRKSYLRRIDDLINHESDVLFIAYNIKSNKTILTLRTNGYVWAEKHHIDIKSKILNDIVQFDKTVTEYCIHDTNVELDNKYIEIFEDFVWRYN